MSFDQDPNEQAGISGADLAILVDELAATKQKMEAMTATAENYRRDAKAAEQKLVEAETLARNASFDLLSVKKDLFQLEAERKELEKQEPVCEVGWLETIHRWFKRAPGGTMLYARPVLAEAYEQKIRVGAKIEALGMLTMHKSYTKEWVTDEGKAKKITYHPSMEMMLHIQEVLRNQLKGE